MVDSYIFEFNRVDSFLDDINREDKFDTLDMDGVTKNYKMVLVSDCPNDINECIDEDGTLLGDDVVQKISTLGADDGKCALLWSKGINGERTLSVNNSTVNYDLGDAVANVKAIFLVSLANGSGYVLAYAINSYAFPVEGEVIMPCDGMIWSITYGG